MLIVNATERTELVTSVINWFYNKTFRNGKFLSVDVVFSDIEEDGFTEALEGNNSNFFELELREDLTDEELVMVLLHEMVHVKQYTRGEVKQTKKGISWKGVYGEYSDYKNQPWELEAYGTEEILFKKYTEETNNA